MNIILNSLTEDYSDWVVQESCAQKEGKVYTAVIQMMMGYIRTGIYHRGFALWEQDHHRKTLIELKNIVRKLNEELILANEHPQEYINGVVKSDQQRKDYLEVN